MTRREACLHRFPVLEAGPVASNGESGIIRGKAFGGNNAVTVNPIGLLVGVLSGEYESQTSPGSTLGIRGALWQPALGPEYDDVTLLGAGLMFSVGYAW